MSLGQSSFVNAPFLYSTGLNLTWMGNTTLRVGFGNARTLTNSFDINLPLPVIINAAFKGVNGLDTGTLANNTWYAVYVIYSTALNATAPTACMISTNIALPLLPYGYDSFRRIGWVLTNGSAQFVPFTQGNNVFSSTPVRSYQWNSKMLALNAGTSTTYAPVSLAGVVPPNYGVQPALIQISMLFQASTLTATGSLRPTGQTTTAGAAVLDFCGSLGTATTTTWCNYPSLSIMPGVGATLPFSPSIDYVISAGSLSIWVNGFVDNL